VSNGRGSTTNSLDRRSARLTALSKHPADLRNGTRHARGRDRTTAICARETENSYYPRVSRAQRSTASLSSSHGERQTVMWPGMNAACSASRGPLGQPKSAILQGPTHGKSGAVGI
jgi:hypothetical protein